MPSPLNRRAVLIDTSVVRAVTGWRPDEIYARVDGGDLLHEPLIWVFNFASDPDGAIRDLRFFAGEIIAPEIARTHTLGIVLRCILPGDRTSFHAGEVLQLFALSRPGLAALRGQLNGHLAGARNTIFPRAGLESFLLRRWLGNQAGRLGTRELRK
jgi:hypothetical protein